MTVSLYQISVPVYLRQLSGLSAILKKAASHCAEHKIDPAALLDALLYPDMFPLTRQVQIACSHVERGTSRLAGLEPPSRAGKEASFEELTGRIAEAVAYVKGTDPALINGKEDREITFPVGDKTQTLKGIDYLLQFSMPNFYFHVTAAYAILRHNGLRIGKSDYLGSQ